MSIEEELKLYIVTKYGTLTKFGEKVNLSQSTLSTIFKRGIRRTSITRIFKICDELGISADALAEGKIMPKSEWGKEKTEVMQAFQMMRNQVILTIDGKPLSKVDLIVLTSGLHMSIEMVKQKRLELENKTNPDYMLFNDDGDVIGVVETNKDLSKDHE